MRDLNPSETPGAEPLPDTERPATPKPSDPAPLFRLIPRQLSYRIGNLQGIGSRSRQEDSFCFVNAMDVTAMREQGLLAVMADGMGGMADGKLASETVAAGLREEFLSFDRSKDLGRQLRSAVHHANDLVYQQLSGKGGSTVVVCLFYQQQLWFSSVGDSALFLLRDGEVLRLNYEQNVMTDKYREAIRRGSTDPSPARNSRERDALTQFVGMPGMDEIDGLLQPLKLHAGDIFLLCSDGVADMIPGDLLLQCMQQPDPMRICTALEDAVLNANNPHQDNYTALVVQCGY